MKLRVIVNPTSGGGKAAKAVPVIERTLQSRGVTWSLEQTEHPGHATELARRALRDYSLAGADAKPDVLLVVGGDGTFSEVCQAYLDERADELGGEQADEQADALAGPCLALLAAGTGSDFCRSLSSPQAVPDAVEAVLHGEPRPIDLGVARSQGRCRAFANVASFGLSGRVASEVNSALSKWSGRLAYLLTSARTSLVYDNPAVELLLDDRPWFRGRVVTVAIANGSFFGGGMRIAPKAAIDDGVFDVVVLGDYTKAQTLGLARHIYRGTHVAQAQTVCGRGRKLEARILGSDPPPLIELDGENWGQLPASFEILPGALRLVGT